jgi:hypothetical protein
MSPLKEIVGNIQLQVAKIQYDMKVYFSYTIPHIYNLHTILAFQPRLWFNIRNSIVFNQCSKVVCTTAHLSHSTSDKLNWPNLDYPLFLWTNI